MFISPHIPDKYYSSWAQYSILAPEGIDRDNVIAELDKNNIPTNGLLQNSRPLTGGLSKISIRFR